MLKGKPRRSPTSARPSGRESSTSGSDFAWTSPVDIGESPFSILDLSLPPTTSAPAPHLRPVRKDRPCVHPLVSTTQHRQTSDLALAATPPRNSLLASLPLSTSKAFPAARRCPLHLSSNPTSRPSSSADTNFHAARARLRIRVTVTPFSRSFEPLGGGWGSREAYQEGGENSLKVSTA